MRGSTHVVATAVGELNMDQSSRNSNSSWFQLIFESFTK